MSTINDTFEWTVRAHSELQQLIKDAVLGSEESIIEANRRQLGHGKDANGHEMAPSYREDAYAEFKHQMNPQAGFGVPDLILSGEFIRGFRLDENTFQITGDDPKTGSLVEKYGHIFGLSPESVREIIPDIQKDLVNNINNV